MKEKVLLDTDIIIEILRNHQTTIKEIKQLYEKGIILACCPITFAEIYAGIRKGEEKTISNFFNTIICYPIDEKIGIKAGMYLKKYSQSYGVEIADALIAGCARQNDCLLMTRNKKHYPMMKEKGKFLK